MIEKINFYKLYCKLYLQFFWNFFWKKMSNLNDYEDEEIITMKNSLIQIRIKKGIFYGF